jgi:hypothetical protein
MSMQSKNPYEPPKAHIADVSGVTPGSPVKAISLGLAVDVGGTLLAGVLFSIAYGVSLVAFGTSGEQITRASFGPLFQIGNFVIGGVFSVFGGFVCARIARRLEYVLGGVLATVSSALGFLMAAKQPFLQNALLTLATFVSILIGSALGRCKNRQS